MCQGNDSVKTIVAIVVAPLDAQKQIMQGKCVPSVHGAVTSDLPLLSSVQNQVQIC